MIDSRIMNTRHLHPGGLHNFTRLMYESHEKRFNLLHVSMKAGWEVRDMKSSGKKGDMARFRFYWMFSYFRV